MRLLYFIVGLDDTTKIIEANDQYNRITRLQQSDVKQEQINNRYM